MPFQAAKDILDSVKEKFENVYVPAMDKSVRGALSDDERRKARDTKPEFRSADDEWQELVRKVRRRNAQGEGDR